MEKNLTDRRLIIAPLLAPSSWQASSSVALRKEICRSAVLLSDDGSSTGTAFLTDFFPLRQIFDPDTPALHSCRVFFLEDIRAYCYVIGTEEN